MASGKSFRSLMGNAGMIISFPQGGGGGGDNRGFLDPVCWNLIHTLSHFSGSWWDWGGPRQKGWCCTLRVGRIRHWSSGMRSHCWPAWLFHWNLQVIAPLNKHCDSPLRSSGVNLTAYTLYVNLSRCWPHILLYSQTDCSHHEKASILLPAKNKGATERDRGVEVVGSCTRYSLRLLSAFSDSF